LRRRQLNKLKKESKGKLGSKAFGTKGPENGGEGKGGDDLFKERIKQRQKKLA